VFSTSPVYRDGDLVALAPGTAKVAVEVKSQLDKDGIDQSLINMRSVRTMDPDIYGMVFGYDGAASDTFAEHVRGWASANLPAGGAGAGLPNRFYNLQNEFLVVDEPPPGVPAGGTVRWVLEAPVPVPRFFLPELLARLNVDNLRDFLPAEAVGKVLERI
jgi:hypothetical protein